MRVCLWWEYFDFGSWYLPFDENEDERVFNMGMQGFNLYCSESFKTCTNGSFTGSLNC